MSTALKAFKPLYNIWSPLKNLNPSDLKMQFQTLHILVSVSDRYRPIWKKHLSVINRIGQFWKWDISVFIGIGRYEKKLIGRTLQVKPLKFEMAQMKFLSYIMYQESTYKNLYMYMFSTFKNSYFLHWNFDWKSCFVVFFLEWNEWKNPQFNISYEGFKMDNLPFFFQKLSNSFKFLCLMTYSDKLMNSLKHWLKNIENILFFKSRKHVHIYIFL